MALDEEVAEYRKAAAARKGVRAQRRARDNEDDGEEFDEGDNEERPTVWFSNVNVSETDK